MTRDRTDDVSLHVYWRASPGSLGREGTTRRKVRDGASDNDPFSGGGGGGCRGGGSSGDGNDGSGGGLLRSQPRGFSASDVRQVFKYCGFIVGHYYSGAGGQIKSARGVDRR